MKWLASLALIPLSTVTPAHAAGGEQLGTVHFSTSCAAAQQSALNRGVALLHDFWYEEAQRQFQQIAQADPSCAMAHWGIAMSLYHQIWDRPSPDRMTRGWSELEKAKSAPAKTAREREYIDALSAFYKPGKDDYEARATAYSGAMQKLFRDYPDDTDAGAFYALSLLASENPGDTSLDHERRALAVLTPLFTKYPDHPGLAHYIIHACDNPTLAPQALNAAQRYGTIAPGAAHSAHMPGHIFARLGMWQPDIEANLASVSAGQKAFKDHPSALFDQLHAYDFLLYAYLQSAQDENAKGVVDSTATLLKSAASMGNMPGMDMSDMIPEYREEFPTIYALEMRDWKTAASLTPASGATPEAQMFTYWARILAEGHLHQADAARADLSHYQQLIEAIKKGEHAYFVDSTGMKVAIDEVVAWAAFAQNDVEKAELHMRAAADLQDKVGQGEVDIPAREMLGDVLFESQQPQKALAEYQVALKESPNRFNGLFHAGQAAEAAGNKELASRYFSALLQNTGNGAQSSRSEFAHVRAFLSGEQVAAR